MAIKATATISLSAVRDLQSCTRYYLLQSSTLSPPAKPTTKPPDGSWVTTEPSYTAGNTNSLYFCDLNVFTDGDFAYSDVSLSSSSVQIPRDRRRQSDSPQTGIIARGLARIPRAYIL